MKNEEEPVHEDNQKKKEKQKRKGKIAQAYKMHQKGRDAKEIAEQMKLKESVVRSYIWRSDNPEKYKALLDRYFTKKKEKSLAKAEKKPAETEKTERTQKAKIMNQLSK